MRVASDQANTVCNSDSIYSAFRYSQVPLFCLILVCLYAACVVLPVGSIEFTIIPLPFVVLYFFIFLSFYPPPLLFPFPYFLLLSLHSKGLLVLKELGFEVETYIASEIDPDAVKVNLFLPDHMYSCLRHSQPYTSNS